MGLFKTIIENHSTKAVCSECGTCEGMGAAYFTIYKSNLICEDCLKKHLNKKEE